jgi:hypothetical protein
MVQSVFMELTDGEDGVGGLGKKQEELERNIDKVCVQVSVSACVCMRACACVRARLSRALPTRL